MRICFIHRRHFGFLPDVYEYSQNLTALGHEVTFVGSVGRHLVLPGVRTIDFDYDGALSFASEIRGFLKRNAFDIVHVFHFRGAGLIGWKKYNNAQYIIDIRTLHVNNRHGRVSKMSYVKDKITWLETQFYDRVLALTNKIKRRLWPQRNTIGVIPLGATRIDLPKSLHSRSQLRSKYDIPIDSLLFIYSGTLSPNRKPEMYIKAFEAFHKLAKTNCHLLLVGDDVSNPKTLNRLKALAKSISAPDFVKFTGRIPYTEVKHLLVAADIGLCYIPPEGSIKFQPATKILEYVAAGLLVVTNDTPANIEMMNYLKNGVVTQSTIDAFVEGMLKIQNQTFSSNNEIELFYWDKLVSDQLIPFYLHKK